MIQMIRVDYRLLHGQVAVSWTSALGADCILLVSDTVLNDKLRLQALSLAKPEGCKVVVKNTEDAVKALQSGVTDKYKLFVVCETIQQAGAVAKAMGIARTPARSRPAYFSRPKTRHTSKSCSARAMSCSFR